MSLKLQIGTLNLTQYLRLAQGEGMDPADSAFSEKVISTSVLREGGLYSLEQARPKAQVYPLLLKAANKDALHQLVQQINQALLVTNQTVFFQDDGASQNTVWDLLTGQLDEEYDFRRGQHSYLAARLRLFTQPFGHAAVNRAIATAFGTGPFIQAPLGIAAGSPIIGDAAAELIALVTSGSLPKQKSYVAFSVLPDNYTAEFHAASMAAAAGSVVGGSGAAASIYRHAAFPAGAGTTFGFYGGATLPLASNYAGENRVFAVLRSNIPSLTLHQVSAFGLGATKTFFGSDWNLVDLGIMRVPDARAGYAGIYPGSQPLLGVAYSFPSNAFASRYLDINELIVLPESSTTFLSVTLNASAASVVYRFDGMLEEVWTIQPPQAATQFRVTGGALRLNDCQRGVTPKLSPLAASPNFAALVFPATSSAANDLIGVTVVARERTRYMF